jgi:hypothetical protein
VAEQRDGRKAEAHREADPRANVTRILVESLPGTTPENWLQFPGPEDRAEVVTAVVSGGEGMAPPGEFAANLDGGRRVES